MSRRIIFFPFLIITLLILAGCSKKVTMITGGFTETGENGLSVIRFNTNAGDVKMVSQYNAGPNPSWLCFSKSHNLIYALNEVMEFNGFKGGGITTLCFHPRSGEIEKKGEIVIPYGGPCHMSVSADGRYIFIASYASGSVAVARTDESGIPVMITDTILYEADSLKVSHAHMILQDPAGKYIYVADLGLDRIVIYSFDNITGKLSRIKNGIVNLPNGAGPRHFTFNSEGSYMYLINELNSTVVVFMVNGDGTLKQVQSVSTLPSGFNEKNACAEIVLSNDGKYLYGSNRGDNSIVSYKVSGDGTISPAGHSGCGGDWPRNFTIDPTCRFLIAGNQKSDMISILEINNKTGIPELTTNRISIKAPAYLEFWK